MKSQTGSWSRSGKVVYIVVMTAAGIIALLVTWQATGSVWWGLLAMLAAGPVMQLVLRLVGVSAPLPQNASCRQQIESHSGDLRGQRPPRR